MRSIAIELSANLDEQVRVWRRLLELSTAQLEALSRQDVHSVHAILQDVELTMLDRARTEMRRGMLIEQAASELGIASSEVTRELVIAGCDTPLADAITRTAEELKVLVVALDSVVDRNRMMLEQELAILEVLVRGATEDTSATPTYGKTGANHEAPRLRLLDAQV